MDSDRCGPRAGDGCGGLPRRRVLAGAAILLWGMCAGVSPLAAGDREHTLKAGFLVNFGQFAAWPSSAFPGPHSPFVIGVFGLDPFGRTLDEVVHGVDVNGRRIQVRHAATADEIRRCHVLYIVGDEVGALRQAVDLVGDAPVLTVGDGTAFIAAGGMVAFRIERNRLRFDVNAAAVKRARLVFSSQMLALARVVTP